MQNPLENFLLNLAEKIQTEKEYKEIVKNSESVDVNKDVFAGFIEGIANTIKENVKNEPTEEKPSSPDPLDNFLSTLGEKLKNLPEKKKEEEPVKENEPVKQKEPVEEPKPVETKPENEPIKSEENETPDAFAGFVNNLANILKKTPEQKTEQPVENEKPKEQVNDYVKVLSNNKKVKTPEIKNVEKKPEENEETPDIKKFVANFVTKELESFKNDLTEKYLKKAAVLSEYAGGGGTNAVQYANGGTMNGDLNVNGHILSGGRDISNFFGNGGGGGTQTLFFNSSNADLSISGGNTVSLSALSGGGGSPTDRLVSGSFQVVLSSDGTINIPGLLTVPNLSGGAILTAVGYDDIEGFYGQSNIPVIQNGINGTIDISNVGIVTVSNSGENYTNGIAIIGGGTRIIISVTSPGWVYNSNGSITFPNGSTQTTAFTGNPDSSNWDSTYTTVKDTSGYWSQAYTNLIYNSAAYLSGVDISLITTTSASWNSVYTSFNSNSAKYDSNYTTVNNNSSSWSSVYTNVNSNSSNYALTNTNVIFQNNVTVLGNLTAKGTATFANTIFTTTSALSVVNTGPGPALYVFQSNGPSDVASFYDGDGVEVLHVGNAQGGGNPLGQVGINTSDPSAELTVNGAISSNGIITVLGGNSNQWNSNYTTTRTNSANYILDGGNAKGANISIGTNDAYNLTLRTLSTTHVQINSSGEVNFYTNLPGTLSANLSLLGTPFISNLDFNPNAASLVSQYVSISPANSCSTYLDDRRDIGNLVIAGFSINTQEIGGSIGDFWIIPANTWYIAFISIGEENSQVYLTYTSRESNQTKNLVPRALFKGLISNGGSGNTYYQFSSAGVAYSATPSVIINSIAGCNSYYVPISTNVHLTSKEWSDAYTTTNTNSASWSSAYTTLCSTSAFRISNTITSALFPNGYTFSSSDTGKTYHVDTRSTPVSVLLPSSIPNDFNVTLVTLGTNNMHVSSSQMPMLCATGTRVNFAFASTFLYKYDDLFWGLGSLI